jgi:hypothetical protein
MNTRIQQVIDKYAGLTPEEIKSTYSELTVRPSQRKKNGAVNDKNSKIKEYIRDEEEVEDDSIADSIVDAYDGGWISSKPKKRGY